MTDPVHDMFPTAAAFKVWTTLWTGDIHSHVHSDTTLCKARFPRQAGGFSTSPVDGGLPTAVVAAKDGSRDTTSESTRSQWRCNAGSGPRRPKGHDRLMQTVQPPPDAAPQAPCPVCGRTSVAASLRLEDGVSVADYRDGAGHIWTTKWLVPA